MVKDIFPELRLDVPSIEKHIAPNMLCLRDLEVMQRLLHGQTIITKLISIWICFFALSVVATGFYNRTGSQLISLGRLVMFCQLLLS